MADQEKQPAPAPEGGVGASDGNNGGGAAAGIPDAETGMRIGDIAQNQDVQRDRAKLFPGSTSGSKPAAPSKES
ncbi:MAG TPA: hypothetical protein VGB55_04835 [Tepidisphaeraceae bacterium]|jgi:hypothetical protein